MADQKVSDLAQAVTTTTDKLYVSQNNTDKNTTVKKLFDAINAPQAKTANYTVQNTDDGNLLLVDATSGNITITLESAAAVHGLGFVIGVKKIDSSSNTVTIDADGSEAIDGSLTKVLSNQNDSVVIVSDGADWQIKSKIGALSLSELPDGSKLDLQTEQATTSGAEIDFTGIPSWVQRITVMINGVSTTGSDAVMIQLGDSGGFEGADYDGAIGVIDAGASASNSFSSGFLLEGGSSAAVVLEGAFVLTLEDAVNNVWAIHGCIGRSSGATANYVGGTKALSAILTQIRLTTTGGSNTFDAGAINILLE